MLNPSDSATETQLLLPHGVLAGGENLELERDGRIFLLMPAGLVESGEDYEQLRFRQMIRESE